MLGEHLGDLLGPLEVQLEVKLEALGGSMGPWANFTGPSWLRLGTWATPQWDHPVGTQVRDLTGTSRELRGRVIEASKFASRALLVISGASWVLLGTSWLPLGPSWVPLGSSWGPPGCPVLWATPPGKRARAYRMLTGSLRQAYGKPTGINQGVW